MRMTARWIGALALGVFLALLSWQITLAVMPRVIMAFAVTRLAAVGHGYNHFAHAPPVTAASRTIVRPSPDLLYSACAFDVSRAPLLIEAAPAAAPYWSLSIFDARTDVVFVTNNQQSMKPVRVAVVQRGQQAPAGYQPVRVESARGVALIRILIDRAKPWERLDVQRRGARCFSAG